MKARFAGKCEYCEGAIAAGEDCYFNLTTKRISHHGCTPKESPAKRHDAVALAEQLGFMPHGELMAADRPLQLLSRRDRDRPAATVGGNDAAHGEQHSLFGMQEKER